MYLLWWNKCGVLVLVCAKKGLTPLPCLHTQREGAPLETINIQLQTQRGASQHVDAIS